MKVLVQIEHRQQCPHRNDPGHEVIGPPGCPLTGGKK